MTDLQIKYFIKAAQRLNFSEAAKELFITQPALSQQITAIENELNMQLFIRDRNKLRLTPAATVLMRELPECNRRYQEAITNARVASEGHSGILRLGVLEGQILPDNFRAAYHEFRRAYPNVHIELCMQSFRRLRQSLDEQKLDVALTIKFDVTDSPAYLWIKTDQNYAAMLVSKYHPLAGKKIHDWRDLQDETIILVDTEDSATVREKILEDCRQAEFVPRLLLAPSLDDEMLWIDAGLGVGGYDKKLPFDSRDCFVIAWHRENINAAVALFTNFVAAYIQEHKLLN